MPVSMTLMVQRMRIWLRGMGSIMDICPASNAYEQFVPKNTAEERLYATWARVGTHIRNAAGAMHDESATQAEEIIRPAGKSIPSCRSDGSDREGRAPALQRAPASAGDPARIR